MSEIFYYRYTVVYFQGSSIDVWLEIEPSKIPRCLWWDALASWILLRLMVGWIWTFFFLENSTFWAGLLGSGLKTIFQLWAHSEINNRSLLRILLALSFLSLKVTFATKLFLPLSSPWWVINEFFYLKKKTHTYFVLEIFRFLCCSEIHRFQNLWRHHRHCYVMEVTLILISFES